jgi:hypothetical protein
MPGTRPSEWLFGETGERMLDWIRLGATIGIAADMEGISESRLNYWYELSLRFPQSPMAELIAELRAAEAETTNGHSTTGNIVGKGHWRNGQGRRPWFRWDD